MESTVVTFLTHQLFCFCVFLRLIDFLFYTFISVWSLQIQFVTPQRAVFLFLTSGGDQLSYGLKHRGRIGLPPWLHTQQTYCRNSACCKDCSNKECMINSRKLTRCSCITVKTSTVFGVGSQGGHFYKKGDVHILTFLQGAIPWLSVKGSHGRWSVVIRVCVCVLWWDRFWSLMQLYCLWGWKKSPGWVMKRFSHWTTSWDFFSWINAHAFKQCMSNLLYLWWSMKWCTHHFL